MSVQQFTATAYVDWYKQGGTYPPVTGPFTHGFNFGKASRTLFAGLYDIYADVVGFLFSRDPNGRVASANLLITIADIVQVDTRQLHGEWINWDGSLTSQYTDQSVQTAFTVNLSALSVGVNTIPLSALENIPYNGTKALRLTVSGGAPSGKNYIIFNTPIIECKVTTSLQPRITSPLNNERLDRTQVVRVEWIHNDGRGVPQGRFILQYSTPTVNGGAWTDIADISSPNTYYDVSANFFPLGAYVSLRVYTFSNDSLDLPSEVSDVVQIYAGAAVAIPTPTAPIGQIATAFPVLTATTTEPSIASWQAKVIRVSDGATIADSGELTGTMSFAVTVALLDLTSYKVAFRNRSSIGVMSGWGYRDFNTVFTPPMTPTLVLLPSLTDGTIELVIGNPTPGGGNDTTHHNNIWYSDDGVYFKVIKSGLAINTNFIHRLATPKRFQYYYIEAVGDSGGVAKSVVRSAKAKVSMGLIIRDIYDLENTIGGSVLNIKMYKPSQRGAWGVVAKSLAYYEGRDDAVVHRGKHRHTTFDATFTFIRRVDAFNPTDDFPTYLALIQRQSLYSIQTASGLKYVGEISDVQYEEETQLLHSINVTLHLETIDINEADLYL